MPLRRRHGNARSAGRTARLPLLVAVTATLMLAVCTLVTVRIAGERANATTRQLLQVQQLTGTVQYLDEVLTMAANMAAHTSDPRWRARYDLHVQPLDEAIAGLRAVSPTLFDREMGADTDAANRRLVAMETRAFELVAAGRAVDAAELLDSQAYAVDKALYAQGNHRAQQALAEEVARDHAAARALGTWTSLATLLFTVIASGAWAVLSRRQKEAQARVALELARATTQAADDANRRKSLFVANTSHELRTPLTAILGYAELLTDPQYAARHSADACATITRNGEHLLQVVNDLLDMSKIEAGCVTVERISTDPAVIVEDVVSLMRVRAHKKGIELDRTFTTPLPRTVTSDPTRLRQILLNLVGNAIKFTPAGRVVVRIEYDATPTARALRFCVEDNGIGMTAEQTAKLFQSFVQADATTERRFGGTGLGLAISKRYAEMLGGDITVRSCPGTGSAFTLQVPVAEAAAADLWQPDAEGLAVMRQDRSASRRTDAPSLRSVRVLLAEDGPDNRRLVTHHLEHCGAEVIAVEDGRQAVARLLDAAQPPFDLVLMDMQMPELDGYRATHLLRERGCRVPIVALTANAMATDRERCLHAGCDDYLTKPIDRSLLLRTCALWSRPAGQTVGDG